MFMDRMQEQGFQSLSIIVDNNVFMCVVSLIVVVFLAVLLNLWLDGLSFFGEVLAGRAAR